MGADEELRGRVEKMREKAQQLSEAAAHAGDPRERERLQEKARRLRAQSEQDSDPGGGDVFPST